MPKSLITVSIPQPSYLNVPQQPLPLRLQDHHHQIYKPQKTSTVTTKGNSNIYKTNLELRFKKQTSCSWQKNCPALIIWEKKTQCWSEKLLKKLIICNLTAVWLTAVWITGIFPALARLVDRCMKPSLTFHQKLSLDPLQHGLRHQYPPEDWGKS